MCLVTHSLTKIPQIESYQYIYFDMPDVTTGFEKLNCLIVFDFFLKILMFFVDQKSKPL